MVACVDGPRASYPGSAIGSFTHGPTNFMLLDVQVGFFSCLTCLCLKWFRRGVIMMLIFHSSCQEERVAQPPLPHD